MSTKFVGVDCSIVISADKRTMGLLTWFPFRNTEGSVMNIDIDRAFKPGRFQAPSANNAAWCCLKSNASGVNNCAGHLKPSDLCGRVFNFHAIASNSCFGTAIFSILATIHAGACIDRNFRHAGDLDFRFSRSRVALPSSRHWTSWSRLRTRINLCGDLRWCSSDVWLSHGSHRNLSYWSR